HRLSDELSRLPGHAGSRRPRRLPDARRMGRRRGRLCAAVRVERQGSLAGALCDRLPDAGLFQGDRKPAARSRMGSKARADVGQVPQAEGAGVGCRRRAQHASRQRHAPGMMQFPTREATMKALKAALVAATALMMPLSAAAAAEDVVIVYDASGSMWGQIDGVSKIEIARDVMADLVDGWSDATNLGLVAYG